MVGTKTPLPTRVSGDGGDADFGAFYKRHFPLLLGVLMRRGAKRPDAEEAAQEAALRTWQRRETFNSEAAAYNFLQHVALNLLIDHYRRQGIAALPHGEFDDRPGSSAPCPVEAAENAEARRGLGAALSLLEPHDRALLIDTEVHGLRGGDLAARYGATPNALRQRRFRLKEKLRKQLVHLRTTHAVLPCSLVRRAGDAYRTLSRWWHDLWAVPASQTVGIVVAVLSLSVSPLTGTPLRAEPSPPLTALVRTDSRTELGHGAVAERAARRAHRPALARHRPKVKLSRPGQDGGNTGPSRVPVVCFDRRCPLGGTSGDAADVLVLHLPAPVGDRQVRQGIVPICFITPDSAVADCDTEGDPDYAVPPPSPPS